MTRHAALLTILLLTSASAAAAQPKQPAARPAEAAQAPFDEQSAREARDRLHQILDQYPPSVAQVLRLDPSLLTKPDYLAPYPTLAAYLTQHPEVAHNPVFFLGGTFGGPQYSDSRSQAMTTIQSVFIGFEVLLGFVAGFYTLGWIAR